MSILHTRTRPIRIRMRSLLTLAAQRATQRPKNIQIQTTRCAGFRMVFLRLDIACPLRGGLLRDLLCLGFLSGEFAGHGDVDVIRLI